MTKSQTAIVTAFTANGWVITKLEVMESGRVWIVAEKKKGHVFTDQSIFGAIGKKGKLSNMEFSVFMYRENITEDYQLRNRLADK